MPPDQKTTRCTRCSAEFTDEEIAGATSCPRCGDVGVPMRIADDVSVTINVHELRILCMWAENWEAKCPPRSAGTVAAIAGRLLPQLPEGTSLTLRGDVEQLQDEYPSAELRDGDGNVIVPPRRTH